jgi:hypothetical protein
MPVYEAGCIVDGWFKLRVEARNREDVKAKIRMALARFSLVAAKTHEPIGTIEGGQFKVDDEDIEVYHPDEEALYHAPLPRERGEVDLS